MLITKNNNLTLFFIIIFIPSIDKTKHTAQLCNYPLHQKTVNLYQQLCFVLAESFTL